jgi:hypothetical protein
MNAREVWTEKYIRYFKRLYPGAPEKVYILWARGQLDGALASIEDYMSYPTNIFEKEKSK